MPFDDYMNAAGLRAVFAAADCADNLGHHPITCAHMFVGLLDAGNVASFATQNTDVSVEKAVSALHYVDLPQVGGLGLENRFAAGLREAFLIAQTYASSSPTGTYGPETIFQSIMRVNDSSMVVMVDRLGENVKFDLLVKEFEPKQVVQN